MSVGSVISNAASKITGAISQAARSTRISFEYLVTTAQIDSPLNPKVQAPTSSASGLYQFIDQTWLATLKKAGTSLGLGQSTNANSKTADGHYTVTEPSMRKAILRLCLDPRASALMADAFTRSNGIQLSSAIGRPPIEGELYTAHFLGLGGAGKLIATAADQPPTDAVHMFPRSARAHRSVFYDRQGDARNVAGVYCELTRRYQMAPTMAFNLGLLCGSIDPLTDATERMASAAASAPQAAPNATGAIQALADVPGASSATVPDPAGTTQA